MQPPRLTPYAVHLQSRAERTPATVYLSLFLTSLAYVFPFWTVFSSPSNLFFLYWCCTSAPYSPLECLSLNVCSFAPLYFASASWVPVLKFISPFIFPCLFFYIFFFSLVSFHCLFPLAYLFSPYNIFLHFSSLLPLSSSFLCSLLTFPFSFLSHVHLIFYWYTLFLRKSWSLIFFVPLLKISYKYLCPFSVSCCYIALAVFPSSSTSTCFRRPCSFGIRPPLLFLLSSLYLLLPPVVSGLAKKRRAVKRLLNTRRG